MNRRLIGVLVSLIVAGLGTWVIVNYVRGADDRALEGQEATQVLVVAQPVAQGTAAEDLGDAVTTETLPASAVAPGAVQDITEISGQVASVSLQPGEQILAARFVAKETIEATRKIEVPADLLEVSVQLSPERLLGGELIPGDYVAIAASFQPFTLDSVEPEGTIDLQDFIEAPADEEGTSEPLRTPNSTHIIAHKVLVTNLQFAEAPQAQAGEETEVSPTELSPRGSLIITLALPAVEVEKLVFTQEFGSVWLAKESPTSSEAGTEVTTRGTIYQ